MIAPVPIAWQARTTPLVPSAVVAFGYGARALARRVLALDAAHRGRLLGAGSEDFLIVRGASGDLPWTDGVLYLGHDAEAPQLLLPTNRRPDVPLDLFARAIVTRFADQAHPLAVVESPALVIPLGGERRIDEAALRRWLERPA